MKPEKLKVGDKVAIVSLSSGILGEKFVSHEVELGVKRLKELGLVPVFMENSKKGLEYLDHHPEKRAEDLKNAFKDKSIKAIISAIGGNDSFRLIPHLASDKEFIQYLKDNPKIFTGYSDTTTIHLLLNKLGLNTFYGPAFLTDFAEFEDDMLPYTKRAINYFFDAPETYKVLPSEVWYEERTDFSPNAVGTQRISHPEKRGYETIKGSGKVTGKLFGGCVEVLARLTNNFNGIEADYKDELNSILSNFEVLPKNEELSNTIFFIETSEEKSSPEKYRSIIKALKNYGVFNSISGLLVGKPCDEKYYDEYKQILKEELSDFNFPVLFNLNFGHSFPRGVLPYGALAELDADASTLTLVSSTLK